MLLKSALFNWLSIKIVKESRIDDLSAKDTFDFFSNMLAEDYNVSNINVALIDDIYCVHFFVDNKSAQETFCKEEVHRLLVDIESEPKYNTV